VFRTLCQLPCSTRPLKRIAYNRSWSHIRIAAAVLGLEERINQVERRVQMLLIETIKDDDL